MFKAHWNCLKLVYDSLRLLQTYYNYSTHDQDFLKVLILHKLVYKSTIKITILLRLIKTLPGLFKTLMFLFESHWLFQDLLRLFTILPDIIKTRYSWIKSYNDSSILIWDK